KRFRKAIRIMCLILVVCLALTAVFFRDNGVNVISQKGDGSFTPETVTSLHSSAPGDFEKLASSGFIELYFNKGTSEVAIKETTINKMWYSMPQGAGGSAVTMQVEAQDGTHYLNSQDSSVAFSSWSYELIENGVKVNYRMFENKTAAQKAAASPDDIAFSVSVQYYLKDGSFFVSTEVKNLSGNTKCCVSDFSVLPYFGAFDSPGNGDFILLPDGCGATAYPAYSDSKREYCLKVYGDDYSVTRTDAEQAVMGAFGLKNADSAYAVIIDSGEEIAEIKAAADKNSFSSVSAHFALSDVSKKDDSLYCGELYGEPLELCYKFLSGDSASYSELASSCREQFIRNGVLPAAASVSQEATPLYITLTGAIKKSAWLPGYDEYTNFSQALDILTRIKAKGIDNIKLRYKNVFKNNSTSLIGSLGGEKKLGELTDYARSQNISVYLDVNTVSYVSFLGRADFFAARSMQKLPSYYVRNETSLFKNTVSQKYRFRTGKSADSFVSDLISKTADYHIDGFCIGDAGNILVSDYSADSMTRDESKESYVMRLPALSNAGNVMIDGANIYMIKNSTDVINIPMTTAYEQSQAYVRVPFVQSVLHGMLTLAGSPLNLEKDYNTAVLNCIEYGVCPSFSAVYSGKNAQNNALFDNIINDIVGSYEQVSQALAGLEGERITSHSQPKSGVFCTTYSDSTRVYVNYNDESVSVGGVSVEAGGYIRINQS
ncbi:MAG: DUF5696 domain-containing protein, partial [Acutalibacteraceae bacterium]